MSAVQSYGVFVCYEQGLFIIDKLLLLFMHVNLKVQQHTTVQVMI